MDPARPPAARTVWKGHRAAFHPDGVRAAVIARRFIVEAIRLGADDSGIDRTEFPIEWSSIVDGLAPQLLPLADGHAVLLVDAHGRASVLDVRAGAAWLVTDSATGSVVTDVAYVVHAVGGATEAGLITRGRGAALLSGDLRTVASDPALEAAWRQTTGVARFSASWDVGGGTLVVGTEDGRVACLRGGERRTLGHHSDIVLSVRLQPDGETVLTTSEDGTVRQWSLGRDDRRFRAYAGARLPIVAAARDQSGDVIATSDSGVFHRWRGPSSDPRLVKRTTSIVAGITDSGKIGLTARDEHAVEVWDTSASARLAVLDDDARDVTDITFVDGGRRIVAHGDGEPRAWTTPPGSRR
jgi:hypothetical protein